MNFSYCPCAQILPLGTIAPNNANQSRAFQQAQKVKCLPGSVTVPDKTIIQTGTYIVPTSPNYPVPIFLVTVYFDKPFVLIPFVTITIDDYGNTPAWVVHVRNITNTSFDLVMKNADKPPGISFAVLWQAIGV
jgi:hypothetical protein